MENLWTHTTITHSIKRSFGISCEAYILADIIYHLQNNKTSKISGWFYGSRESLADLLGVSKRTVVYIINSLVEKGLIERDDRTAYLRTTIKWDEAFVAQGVQNLHSRGAKSALGGGAKSAPNNNNIYSLLLINNNKEDFILIEKQSKEIYNETKAFFLEKYAKELGTEYYFSGAKDGKKIKDIIKKVVFKMKEKSGSDFFSKEDVISAAKIFFEASWEVSDSWLRSNFNLSNIDSKFNDLFSQIKNRSNGNTATKSKASAIRQQAEEYFNS